MQKWMFINKGNQVKQIKHEILQVHTTIFFASLFHMENGNSIRILFPVDLEIVGLELICNV